MKKTPVLFLFLLLFLLFAPGVFAQETEPEDVVFSYFETLYSAYLKNDPIDSSPLFDLDSDISANFVNSFKMLMERRAYIKEKDYLYVETQRFPLKIDIEEVYIDGDDARVVFYLDGNPKLAYPPFMYLGRNIFWLTRDEEGWKIYDRRHDSIDFHNDNEVFVEIGRASCRERV